jgi:hypothetical protein
MYNFLSQGRARYGVDAFTFGFVILVSDNLLMKKCFKD